MVLNDLVVTCVDISVWGGCSLFKVLISFLFLRTTNNRKIYCSNCITVVAGLSYCHVSTSIWGQIANLEI